VLLVLLFFLYKQSPAPKRKSTANGTKGLTSQQVLVNSDQVKAPVYDLFLEAKLSAEVSVFGFALSVIASFALVWFKLCEITKLGESCECSKYKKTLA